MNGKTNQMKGRPKLFEVNLLGHRVRGIRRRQAMHKFGLLIALLLVAVGGTISILGAAHLGSAMRASLGIRSLAEELAEQQRLSQDMDALHYRAMARAEMIKPLIPVAVRRIAWAPKLRVIAEALPPTSGVMSVNAASGELFPDTDPKSRGKGRHELSRLDVAVLYSVGAGAEEHPISFLDRLRDSEDFMMKMDYVRLEATEESNWCGQPVVVLRSSAKGRVKP
jgi:hypothetical protein